MPSPIDFLLRDKRSVVPDVERENTETRDHGKVVQYSGVGSGDFGTQQSNFNISDAEGEQEFSALMHASGYRGGTQQPPDRQVVNAASAHLRSVRGF